MCTDHLAMNCNWGEPEQAPHSCVLKMSVCALLKVCLLLAPWYRGAVTVW